MKRYTLRTAAPQRRRRYDKELNPQQLEVVTTGPGPVLVLAGAGSGKTRTVTYRVAWLLEGGTPPEAVLLLTFTNKASREMLRRVEALVSVDGRRVWGGTFHRVANLILRRHARLLGYGEGYSILDREDSKELVDAAMDDLGLKRRETRFPRPEVVGAVLSLAVNAQRELEQVLLEKLPVFADYVEEFRSIASRYAERKLQVNGMDYDDLLLNLRLLLEEHPDARGLYARRFAHVMVDEYQDTNVIQARIVDLLASEHRNLMVVGDDAQSIYSFRGADFNNILGFPERYPDARQLKLEINYRSAPEILDLANRVIEGNPEQFPKSLSAIRPPRGKPALVPLPDTAREASFVAQRILELRDEGVPLGETAVLYRSHWHSLELQMELSRRRIPYEVRSGIRFFESAHVKDVLAHMRLVANPRDELAWKRVLRLLPRVGSKTAERVTGALLCHEEPLEALIAGAADSRLPKGAAHAYGRLKQTMAHLVEEPVRSNPGEMVRAVVGAEYTAHLYENYEDAERRLEELDQLALFALGFENAEAFLTELALSTNLEAERVMAGGEDEESLVLTTVHQAKGLEWRAVFVLGLTDGRFPSARSLREAGGEAEERRLFYVAITRAKDELYLSYPLIGRDEARRQVLARSSRFLEELNATLLERWQVEEEPVVYEESQEPLLWDDDYPQ